MTGKHDTRYENWHDGVNLRHVCGRFGLPLMRMLADIPTSDGPSQRAHGFESVLATDARWTAVELRRRPRGSDEIDGDWMPRYRKKDGPVWQEVDGQLRYLGQRHGHDVQQRVIQTSEGRQPRTYVLTCPACHQQVTISRKRAIRLAVEAWERRQTEAVVA